MKWLEEIDPNKWAEAPDYCKFCGKDKLAGFPCFSEFCITRRNKARDHFEKYKEKK